MATSAPELLQINPDSIDANPDNPRLIFREADMVVLLESIREVGIKVPLAVYRERHRYRLIDGERRWTCARKLNLPSVPALAQPKPGKLENLLMMFNIHNVRVDWDLLPMALKLGEVARLLEADGKPAGPRDLAGVTGLSLATVNRALDLLGLPQKYQRLLLEEAKKPRDKQRIKADLFIEINKSRRVVHKYAPEVFERVTDAQYVAAMVSKYQRGVIGNVVHFRDISRMARAERLGADRGAVIPVLVELVQKGGLSIETAYQETVRAEYEIRDLLTRTSTLTEQLKGLRAGSRIAQELKTALASLRREVNRLLGNA